MINVSPRAGQRDHHRRRRVLRHSELPHDLLAVVILHEPADAVRQRHAVRVAGGPTPARGVCASSENALLQREIELRQIAHRRDEPGRRGQRRRRFRIGRRLCAPSAVVDHIRYRAPLQHAPRIARRPRDAGTPSARRHDTRRCSGPEPSRPSRDGASRFAKRLAIRIDRARARTTGQSGASRSGRCEDRASQARPMCASGAGGSSRRARRWRRETCRRCRRATAGVPRRTAAPLPP